MSANSYTEIHLGLGSNLGNRLEYLRRAVQALEEHVCEIRLSPVYQSAAWGYEDQPDFLNAALAGKTELSPEELLSFAKKIESQLGREPTFQNGPRVIDIDLLLYGILEMDAGKLILPHPSLRERSFVLQPLVDLSPNLVPPGTQESLRELLATFDPSELHPRYEQEIAIK